MKSYIIIDINGKTHEMLADSCSITDTFVKFWINGEVLDTFVVRNVISITEGNVERVEEEVAIALDKVENDRHGCYDCKYNDHKLSDEPCMTCNAWGSCWEKKEEKDD